MKELKPHNMFEQVKLDGLIYDYFPLTKEWVCVESETRKGMGFSYKRHSKTDVEMEEFIKEHKAIII